MGLGTVSKDEVPDRQLFSRIGSCSPAAGVGQRGDWREHLRPMLRRVGRQWNTMAKWGRDHLGIAPSGTSVARAIAISRPGGVHPVLQTFNSPLNQPRPGCRVFDQPFDHDRDCAKSVLNCPLVEVSA